MVTFVFEIIERKNKHILTTPEQVDYPVNRFILLKLHLLQLNLTGWQNGVCVFTSVLSLH